MKRLEFWTSPAVAPFVRGCTFSAFCRSRDDPSPVFATFFRLLPNLCNLKELNCVMVMFDRAAVQVLCTLSNLARVQLTGCFCAMSQSEVVDLVLHVKSFRCADTASQSSASAHRWLDILGKDTLHDHGALTLRLAILSSFSSDSSQCARCSAQSISSFSRCTIFNSTSSAAA
jgi:hypothetical protein